ncbi:hypothetical protein BS47DRAFT_1401473 [Hydnum rufescens UP504]|uniref:Uncharacterized protein n=1 Tax=Hydnum rufescens UP504 TaxID=1448309 RepID=A0A9P6AFH1_9AGAM|nr:hypothetical protein BS47DRAFT_1401473 [Hydnum rufescens UP504]
MESIHEMSPSMFISAGLEIEVHQRCLRRDVALYKSKMSSRQSTLIQDRRHQLYTHLKSFWSVQTVYMPQVALHLRDNGENDVPDMIENAVLFLLNEIPSRQRNFDHPYNLSNTEARLRFGQATDSLAQLCRALCVKSHLVKYKRDEVRGQRPNTRARALLDRAQAQIDAVIESYNVARTAYHQLVGSGIWEETIRVLHPWDVCAMDDSEGHSAQLGEGYRTLSWIWMAPGLRAMGDTAGTPEMHEALHIEWAKCRACRNRWVEEELLVKEEIRRTIAFCEYKAEQWTEWATARPGLPLDLLDGVRAYAYYQAALQHDRVTSFCVLFSLALDILESMSENDKPFDQDTLALSGHGTDEDLDDEPDDDLDDLEI